MSRSAEFAAAVIKREHRALAAVINNIKGVIDEMQAGRMSPDFSLLWKMVHYIDAFPNQQHHPKEDCWLFERLQQRTDLADALIATLKLQHQGEEQALNHIRRALGNTEAGVVGALDELAVVVARFAEATWRHLRAEEQALLPIAESVLTEADWDDLAAAFGQNRDPVAEADPSVAFEELFSSILLRTPAPFGLGEPGGA